MKVFRLIRKKYAGELSGVGAAKCANRWNSKGVEIIYCSDSRALAMAEVFVHLSLATLPSGYVMMEIDIPEKLYQEEINDKYLPAYWNSFPHSVETRIIGDDFVRNNKCCVLKVPSAVVKGDFNFLLNPNHSDFKQIKINNIHDFPFDDRIFK